VTAPRRDDLLRVVLVLGTSTGGIGTHVRSLAAGLVARGHRVVVAGPESTSRQFAFEQDGSRFVPLEISERPHPRDAVLAGQLSKWVTGADVVHAHGFRSGLVAGFAGAGRHLVRGNRHTPLVVTWHNMVSASGWRAAAYGVAERYVARRSDITLGASQDLVTRATSLGATARLGPVAAPKARQPSRTRNEVRAELGVGDRPLLLAIGRLHPQKDYPTLFAATELLNRRDPRPALVVVGDGPDRAPLTALAQNIEGSGSVTLLGHRDDIADLLQAADVFVLSSTWEARALVVQEAMQAGVPVVATAVGGIPELVGDHALLTRPEDSAALARAIADSLDDPMSATQRAADAKKHAEAWPDEDAVVDQLIETYRAVVAER